MTIAKSEGAPVDEVTRRVRGLYLRSPFTFDAILDAIDTHSLADVELNPDLAGTQPEDAEPPIVPTLTAEQIADLSPGVRDLVVALREAGFYTTDSGDGSNYAAGMECAVPFRMVAILCRPPELAEVADRLHAWLAEHANDYGLPEWGAYRATAEYNPADGVASVVIAESSAEQLNYVESITGERPTGLW